MIFFAEDLHTACRTAAALGVLIHNGRKVKPADLLDRAEEIQAPLKKMGYLTVKVEEIESVFVWADGPLAKIAPASAYGEESLIKEQSPAPFFPKRLIYEAVPGMETKMQKIMDVFCSPKFRRIYHICTGPVSDRIFLNTYGMSQSSLPIYRIVITDFASESVRKAYLAADINISAAWYISEITRDIIYWSSRENLSKIATEAFAEPIDIRVKTLPILALLKTRAEEKNKHQAKKAYAVQLQLTTASGDKFIASLPGQNKFTNELDAKSFIEKLPKTACVTETSQNTEKLWPDGPASLEAVTEAASKKYGYSPENTSVILNRLYKESYISNPYVKGHSYPSGAEAQVKEVLSALLENAQFRCLFTDCELQEIPPGYFSDQENGIFITGILDSACTDEDYNIYRLIAIEQFKTMLPPAVKVKTNISIQCGMQVFTASASEIIDASYMKLDNTQTSSLKLPRDLHQGEQLEVEFLIKPTETVPKSSYTLTQFMNLLTKEDRKLKACFASQYEAQASIRILISEKLAAVSKKSITATNGGILLIKKLEPLKALLDTNTALFWEFHLKKIASQSNPETARHMSGELLERAMQQISDWCRMIPGCAGKITDVPCPVCKKSMYKTNGSYFCRNCGYRLSDTLYDRKMEEEVIGYLCVNKRTPMLRNFVIENKRCWAYLYFDDNMQIKYSLDTDYDCPACGRKLHVSDDGRRLYCPSRCSFSMQTHAYGYRLTREDLKSLFSKRKRTPLITSFHRADGTGYLYLDDANILKCIIVK